jgi:type IV pilus assembly protein PilV
MRTKMREMMNSIGKNKKGFSLIEVLIGLVVLAFGLLSIAAMQIVSIKGGYFSNNITRATVLAQNRLEDLKLLAFNQNSTDPALSGGEHNDGAIPNSVFTRNYTVQDTAPTLKTITVTVRWVDRGDHNISLSTMRAQQ